MDMENIWVLNRECGAIVIQGDYQFEKAECKVLGYEKTYDSDYYKKRKTYFKSRQDAEDYAKPIVELLYKEYIQMIKDRSDEEEDREYIARWENRGFCMIQRDKLTKESPLYKPYHSDTESTIFVIPAEHEYGRIGYYFGGISRATLY